MINENDFVINDNSENEFPFFKKSGSPIQAKIVDDAYGKGIELIAKEREEQLTKHNRSVVTDVVHNTFNQLPTAARMLLAERNEFWGYLPPKGWDTHIWNKMINKPIKERMVIAGALIAAEIDRLSFMEELEKASKLKHE